MGYIKDIEEEFKKKFGEFQGADNWSQLTQGKIDLLDWVKQKVLESYEIGKLAGEFKGLEKNFKQVAKRITEQQQKGSKKVGGE